MNINHFSRTCCILLTSEAQQTNPLAKSRYAETRASAVSRVRHGQWPARTWHVNACSYTLNSAAYHQIFVMHNPSRSHHIGISPPATTRFPSSLPQLGQTSFITSRKSVILICMHDARDPTTPLCDWL
jgi:hypothetical protein